MRIPITVRSDAFDLESVQPIVDRVRVSFADYLDQVPRKSTKSKHGLMGPVGKILSEIKSGRRDPASLKGYAIRVHEVLSRGPSPASLEKLEAAIDGLVKLLNTAPATFHDRILDRLDYGLYYELRSRQAASKEARRQAWVGYLRTKYGSPEALAAAWDEAGITFEELYLPKKSEGARGKRPTARQTDVAGFWETQGVSTLIEEGEEEL
jgi:hypothetical protein